MRSPERRIGAIGTSALIQYGPEPLHLVYALLLAAFAVQAFALWLTRETGGTRPGILNALKPAVFVPPQVRKPLSLVTPKLRRDPAATRAFLDILAHGQRPYRTLTLMNETGLLGRFLPEWGRIVGQTQFNMYHASTVDEHTLQAIGVINDIARGKLKADHPMSTEIVHLISDMEALMLGMLLHDVGKGGERGQLEDGAIAARRACERLGVDSRRIELVVWLVRHHLALSDYAQKRDTADPATVRAFAELMGDPERLRMLLVLTAADIRAVGPGVWNGWKGQLLRTLYYETELTLTGGFSEVSRAKRAAAARQELAAALVAWPEKERRRYVRLHYDNYLLAVDLADQLRHADFIREADGEKRRLATMVKVRAFEAVTEVTVLAPDHPRLLSVITGACAAAGGNIVDAQIFTTTDGRALDTILISREFDRDEDEKRRAERVGRLIEDVLSGKTWLPEMIEKRTKPKRGPRSERDCPRQIAVSSSWPAAPARHTPA